MAGSRSTSSAGLSDDGRSGVSSSLSGWHVDDQRVVRAVTMIIGVVVGLTFVFGFGNVVSLALRLGAPVWVAPLVAPAGDLSVLALLLATRHLALRGTTWEQLQPARRLLISASLVTLALDITELLLTGQFGKAAFDAVDHLLLIGWAEVGPALLSALNGDVDVRRDGGLEHPEEDLVEHISDDLLERARSEDLRHWEACPRPISAETLA